MVTYLKHDAFARETVIRDTVIGPDSMTCDWCGRPGKKKGKLSRLYRYGIESDGGRQSWVKGKFCCKSCMEFYHGK